MLKHCLRCNGLKLLSAFGKNKRTCDGLAFYCKVCDAERAAAHRAANPEHVRMINRVSVDKHREVINARKRAQRAANPERTKSERKATYAKHREKELATMREWKAANRDQMRVQRHGKYWANPGAARARTKAYRQAKPHLARAWRMTRIATKKQAMPAWADYGLITNVYERAVRVMRCTGIPHEVDHIVPLRGMIGRKHVVSGLHVDYNLQVVPTRVNRAKSNVFWPHMPAHTSGAH